MLTRSITVVSHTEMTEIPRPCAMAERRIGDLSNLGTTIISHETVRLRPTQNGLKSSRLYGSSRFFNPRPYLDGGNLATHYRLSSNSATLELIKGNSNMRYKKYYQIHKSDCNIGNWLKRFRLLRTCRGNKPQIDRKLHKKAKQPTLFQHMDY